MTTRTVVAGEATRPPHRPLLLDLLLLVLAVVGFYLPFLEPGIPPGDFGSDVALNAVEETLQGRPWSLPTWNPIAMCGRPMTGLMSPFQLLEVPLGGLEPILRMKVLVLIYHVLAALSMYALMSGIHAGRDAALFAGLVYPVMTSHLTRTAVFGHVQVVMSFAVVPLVFLGFFRLTDRGTRGSAFLALMLALAILRDTQRALILATLLGIAISLGAVLAAVVRRGRAQFSRSGHLLLSFLASFAAAVLINAFDTLNNFWEGATKSAFSIAERARWIDQWSLDNLYSFVDRNGWLGSRLEMTGEFAPSVSRYSGLCLTLLVLVGALTPRLLVGQRTRFWFVLLVLAIAVWLSFGAHPIGPRLLRRAEVVLRSRDVPLHLKAGLGLAALLFLLAILMAIQRNAGFERRIWLKSVLLLALALSLFATVAPLPLVVRVVFFLGAMRNPEWFHTTIASFAVAFAASLVVGGICRGRSRLAGTAVTVGLAAVAVADFAAYRPLLDDVQRTPAAVVDFLEVAESVASDPDDGRVLSAEPYSNIVDLTYIWHRKRLAWDFRSYAATERTRAFMKVVHRELEAGRFAGAATLAGIANVRYILDERRFLPDIPPSPQLTLIRETSRMRALGNRRFLPFVQSWPRADLLVGGTEEQEIAAAGELAARGILLLGVGRLPDRTLRASVDRVYGFPEGRRAGLLPADAVLLEEGVLPEAPRSGFEHPPELAWRRPAPEVITIRSRASAPYALLVAESYDPRWAATLDGNALALYPGAHAFLAAFVPAGEHEVVLSYVVSGRYFAALGVGFLSLAVTLLLLRRGKGGHGRVLLPGALRD